MLKWWNENKSRNMYEVEPLFVRRMIMLALIVPILIVFAIIILYRAFIALLEEANDSWNAIKEIYPHWKGEK